MPLDPQVIEIYKNKPAASKSFSLEEMRKNADSTFNDKTEITGIYHWEDRLIGDCLHIRIYVPGDKRDYPVMLYFHGGGFVMHNIASHDSLCRKLSSECCCIVVSVGYRLAPENKYPACIEDAYTALEWVYENARSLGGHADRIYTAGDSAGANISAVLSLLTRDRKGPSLYGQILFYGLYGAEDENSESMRLFGNGEYVLPKEMYNWCNEKYIPKNADMNDPYIFPAKSSDLSGLPKTLVITAEYDPLRDDGEAFYKLLKSSGNDTQLIRMDGFMHGFMLYWHRLDRAKDLISKISDWIGNNA